MRRGAIGVLVLCAAVGCNKSGGPGDAAGLRAEARTALKDLDARVEPENSTPDKPVMEIALSGDKVTDDALAHVARFPTVQTLRLRNTAVMSAGMARLGGLVALTKLDLSGTKVGDDGLAQITHLAGLRTLLLERTPVTDAGMASVGRLTGLQELRLNETAVGDAGLAELKSLSSLEELGLDRTKVTDAGLPHLVELKKLHTIYVDGTAITVAGRDKFRRQKPGARLLPP